MFILLTGPARAGKTTACWKALPGLRGAGIRIAGFISPPLLDAQGSKTGIEMIDLATNQHYTFARVVNAGEDATVGSYRMDDDAIAWARAAMSAALLADVDWLVVDEIGPLELHRGLGYAFALAPLADPERVPNALVLVREGLVEELMERLGRTDFVVVSVNAENRGEVPAQLVALVLGKRR